MRFLDRLQPLGLLVLRVTLGAIMVAHGYSKVFGGLQGFAGFVGSLGLPWWLGYVAAFAEFVGGLFLIFGILTRWAALTICVEMLVALWKVAGKGSFMGQSSAHLPLLIATAALLFVFFGGGRVSFDAVLFRAGARPARNRA
ncbi:MAG TPA: DoxX family protein [Terriglobales bacterium]|nr:DoxX family protein [Terriglobales bacterium]